MLSPLLTIRKYCRGCVETMQDIKTCGGKELAFGPCPFYPFRLKRGRPRLRVLRNFCIDCMGGSLKSINECPTKTCPVWPYRMGHRPEEPKLYEIVFKRTR